MGVLEKILSVGEACKFSGTRQLRLITVTVLLFNLTYKARGKYLASRQHFVFYGILLTWSLDLALSWESISP